MAEGEPPSFLDSVSSYDVALQRLNAGGNYDTITNGQTVSFNELLRIVYSVTIKNTGVGVGKLTNLWNAINALEAGAQYYIEFELPIPDGLKYQDIDKNIEINTGTEDAPNMMYFATLYPAADGSGVFLRFEKSGFWENPLPSTEEVVAEVYVACKLDDSALMGKTDAVISLNSKAIVNIDLADTLPNDHGLTKRATPVSLSANANTNQVIDWTVTYDVGSDPVTPPITFYDTFDSQYNTYVVGSFRISTNGGATYTTVTPHVEHSTTSDMIALSYVYSNAVTPGQTIIFKYHTMMTNESLFGDASDTSLDVFYASTLRLDNHAEMRVRDTKYANADATIDVGPEDRDKHWLAKRVTNADQNNMIYGKDIISWEVDVRAFDLGFEHLYLYDTIPNGLTLLNESVKISVDGGKTYASCSSLGATLTSVTAAPGGVGTPVPAFKLELPTKANGNYYQSYRVIYDTRVSIDHMYTKNGNGYIIPAEFDNIAWLDYAWPPGHGTYKPVPPEVKLTGVGVDAPIILKTGTYDASTHRIKWTVTVNPFGTDVVDGTVTDYFTNTGVSSPSSINDRNMRFLPGTFASEKNAADADYFTLLSGYNDTGSVGRNEFSIRVNGLGKNTAKFTYETEVLDERNTEYNSSRQYRNDAEFDGHINLYDTSGDLAAADYAVKDTADATPTVNSTVLAKSAGAYDYTDNTIKWTVTVNHNKMPMNGAYIVDTIPQYLYVDTSTISISGVSGAVWSYTVTENDATAATEAHAAVGATTLKVDFGNLTDQQVIVSYKTRLLVDDPTFKKTYSLTVKNSVILKRAVLGPTPVISATQTITNKVLDKSGAFIKENGVNTSKIEYTVKINPHGIDLEGYTLVDTLPKGLDLDLNSIRLWETSVSSAGVITKTGTEAAGYTWSYKYSSGSRSFSVKLPGDDTYVLTYTCIIASGAATGSSFTNTIAFEEPDFSGNAGAVGTGFLMYGGWALSRAKGSLSLKITKRDSKNETKLDDVTFELLTLFPGDTEPTMIMDGKTNANGELTFEPLNFLREYWIREVSGITGYSNTDTAFAVDHSNIRYELEDYSLYMFTADAANDVQNVAIEIYNYRDEYDFSFLKVSDSGLPLSGVEFMITDQDDPTFTRTASSGSNGKVHFEDIPWGEYNLVETSTPANHIPNQTVYTVSISSDGSYVIKNSGMVLPNSSTGDGAIINERAATLNITKKDSKTGVNIPLPGVVFELWTTDASGNDVKADTRTTDADGKLSFYPIVQGNTYTLKETGITGYLDTSKAAVITGVGAAPVPLDQYTFSFADANSTLAIDITILNDRDTIDMSFTKTDTEYNGLPGAQFTLTDKDSGAVFGPETSGTDGKVTFAGIPFGDYALKETFVPYEYAAKSYDYIVSIAADGSYVIQDTNGSVLGGSNIEARIVNYHMQPLDFPTPTLSGPTRPTPTPKPTPTPSPTPSPSPTPDPASDPTLDPSSDPSTDPSNDPAADPTQNSGQPPVVPGDADHGINDNPIEVDPLPQTGSLDLSVAIILLVIIGLALIASGILMKRYSAKRLRR